MQMLWNWNTIDACFIARSWHIRSNAAFAGSCIGMVALVMSLELLRRLAKEYDAYIIRSHIAALAASEDAAAAAARAAQGEDGSAANGDAPATTKAAPGLRTTVASFLSRPSSSSSVAVGPAGGSRKFTPTLLQQMVRATFHLLQFAVAYFVMLMAMYYNGYIIICILIGAWLGSFIFGWEGIALP